MTARPFNGRFIPSKRTAVDGKVWWVVYDAKQQDYSHIVYFGKYKTRTGCQFAIDRLWRDVCEGKLMI